MAKTDLSGRVAVITGAARGIGLAVAELAASRGAGIAIWDMDEAAAKAAAASLGQAARVSTHILDLTDAAAVEAATQATLSAHGRIDILVNNAGISGSAVGDMLSLEGWNQLMSINATGVFLDTTLVGQVMAQQGKGSIVNISSIMGFVSSAEGHPGYSASKGAVRLLTKNAAVRWGPQGVRVNSVHPGYLPPMLGGTNGPGRTAKIPLTPLRRLGEAIEVAYGVLFLASDEASFITGTELVIDGGFIAQ